MARSCHRTNERRGYNKVGNVRNTGPELILPIEDQML
jgi:hypothetical protein